MATKKQIIANRENAQKSTGPKSALGKIISSRNSTSHGFYSTTLLLPGEDREQFLRFCTFISNSLAISPGDLPLSILSSTAERLKVSSYRSCLMMVFMCAFPSSHIYTLHVHHTGGRPVLRVCACFPFLIIKGSILRIPLRVDKRK